MKRPFLALTFSSALTALLSLAACSGANAEHPQADDARGADGSGADGSGADAGDARPSGSLHGPTGEWAWHDVAGTICANGTPTGLGVNQGTGSEVVIYLEAGSTCIDAACTGASDSAKKDGGFGAKELADCVDGSCGLSGFPATSIFDRNAALNPYRDATYVFISNCTGDYYSGSSDHEFSDWTAHFHGSENQAAFAAEVAASFSNASRVVLTGSSAGAAGAQLNYWRWVRAFPNTRVDLISDSFAFVFTDKPEWRYDLHNPQSPPGCTNCLTDYRSIYEYNSKLSPSSRIAMLDSEKDLTLQLVSGGAYTHGLQDLEAILAPLANVRYYIAEGSLHMLMSVPLDSDKSDIPAAGGNPARHLSDFIGAMHDDGAAWQSMSVFDQ